MTSLRPCTVSSACPRLANDWISCRTRPRSYSSERAALMELMACRCSISAACASPRPPPVSVPGSARRLTLEVSNAKARGSAVDRPGSRPRVSIARASWTRSEVNVTSRRMPRSTEYTATAARSEAPRPSSTNSRAARRAMTTDLGCAKEKSKRIRKWRRAGAGTGALPPDSVFSARSTASNPRISCLRPSSKRSKSFAASPRTGLPPRSKTRTGTSTSETSAVSRTGPAGSWAAAPRGG